MEDLATIIRNRHSERVPFDPRRAPSESDLRRLLEAARWAPTAHNMQNFEIIVIDDPAALAAMSRVPVGTSREFIRENYAQLSFSEAELLAKGTGLLATMFPSSWRVPDAGHAGTGETGEPEHGFLGDTMRCCPVVLMAVYDPRKRAPASAGDFLGIMSLGCVLQNIWLTAEELGIGLQVMSVFSAEDVADALRRILRLPGHMRIAFACRLGYPPPPPVPYLRVRRSLARFTHRNRFDEMEHLAGRR